jgi:hypothetical protein
MKTRAQLIDALQGGARVKWLPFWGHRPNRSDTVDKSCLSQWYPSPFTLDGTTYPTAEHAMMAGKARLFGDEVALEGVLASRTPGEAKAWGRRVRGFVEERWCAHRFALVVEANVAKFGQAPALASFLRNTHQRVLVEASPVDRIWGIGLAADHPDVTVPRRWRGENLLGFALMEARERL